MYGHLVSNGAVYLVGRVSPHDEEICGDAEFWQKIFWSYL